MEQNIRKAGEAVEKNKERIRKGEMRQRYHFMAPAGWLNDPNGLIYFKGNYHFFYQHNPYSGFWDCMHWGHAISKDLIHWEDLPVALAPSEEYDDYQLGGCFSGSAIEHEGKLYLVYTGVMNTPAGIEQTQCLAYSEDGIHFEKYAGNPVLRAPEGVLKDQFRDPRIWKHENRFYMVCAASFHGRGQAFLYRSADLFHWSFQSILSENRGEWGRMWECPDFFPLGEKYVLTCSPIGVGDHTSICQVGKFDYKTGIFDCESVREMDWGFEYYAPQSFLAPDGRRITTAWANQWQWMPLFKDWGPAYKEGWCGFFNLPREVSFTKDGRISFRPIRELEQLRENPMHVKTLTVSDQREAVQAGDGVSFEMKFAIDLEKTTAGCLELELRSGKGKKTMIEFDLEKGELRVDRTQADGWSVGVSRSSLFLGGKKELDVHIYSDQSSLEIFTDQYTNNQSNNIFAGNDQNGVFFISRSGETVITDLETYGMKQA